MKNLYYALAAFLLLLSGCNQSSTTVITGKIEGGQVDEINYSVPIDGFVFLGFQESASVDSLGNFTINVDLEKTSCLMINIPELGIYDKVVIEPRQKYDLIINKESEKPFQMYGANEEGQSIYQEFPYSPFIYEQIEEYDNVDSLNIALRMMGEEKEAEIVQFKALLDDQKISKLFFDYVKKDRDCYYASLSNVLSFSRLLEMDDHDDRKETVDLISRVYDEYSPGDESLMGSLFWYEYAIQYCYFKLYTQRKIKEMEQHTECLDVAKQLLDGKALEYFEVMHLLHEIYPVAMKKEYDEKLIDLFDQFKRNFPKNKGVKYIDPLASEIKNNQRLIEQPFTESMKFIPNTDNINSLEELIALFKGQKLYIDVWATWCGPCLGEFKNNEKLKKLLKQQGIESVYVSLDKEPDEQRWKDMIKIFNLEGNHIRVNSNLYTDLQRVFDRDGRLTIPWYIMVDENGDITDKHAKRPSELVKDVE